MFGFYEKSFTFFGLNIAYYGLIIAIGMGIGVFIACKNAKFRGLKTDDLIVIACYALPLSIIGARLYFVLFSLDSFHSFVEVLQIWNGGMAIYGGVIGGAIGVALYCLIHKKNFLDVADVIVPSLILGQAIGRWGNFINQEAYGMAIQSESAKWFPIGVYIENCTQTGCTCGGAGWHMATFFYESIWNLATFAILMVLLRKEKLKYRGSLMCFYMIIYGAGRTWIEALRMDSLYIGKMRVSQFLSILMIAFGICFIVTSYFLHKKGKIKSIVELQPYYQSNLSNQEKKDEILISKKKEEKLDNTKKNQTLDINDERINKKEDDTQHKKE